VLADTKGSTSRATRDRFQEMEMTVSGIAPTRCAFETDFT
jgi:hypothetical protein